MPQIAQVGKLMGPHSAIASILGNVAATDIWVFQPGQTLGTDASAGKSYNTIAKAPCRTFTQVRAVFRNNGAASFTVDKLLFAVTANASSPIVPTVGNTITENPATGWVTGGTAIVVPARISSNRPSTLKSTWTDLPSIATSDGSEFPYAIARANCVLGGYTYRSGNPGDHQNSTERRWCVDIGQIVDGTTVPALFTNTNPDGISIFCALEFRSVTKCIPVLAVGDSVTVDGYETPYGSGGWFPTLIANVGQINGYDINWINHAWFGRTTTQFLNLGKDAIDAYAPAFALFSQYSPNDGSGFTTMTTNTASFVTYCNAHSVVPAIVFLAPSEALSDPNDLLRKAMIATAKAGVVKVFDGTPSVGDGANPERFLPGMAWTDVPPVHPSVIGFAAIAAYITGAVRTWLRRFTVTP